MNEQLLDNLQAHFGHSSFRPGQEDIISRVMEGRNVLAILATGGGKSITYQLPALLLPGITVVVSPLISLMMDQVQQLRTRRKIPATYLNSSQDYSESRDVLRELANGAYKLLYVSPEKLQQPYVQAVLKRVGVSLVAIDEAHCISQWGHDFRTDYLRLPDAIRQLGNPTVLAVTATATADVRHEIGKLFQIESSDMIVQALNRANIALDLIAAPDEGERREQVLRMMDELEGPGIVYCSTRQAVEVLVASYQLEGSKRIHGYHGGMESMERVLIQSQFLADELDVIIATNAFGMGIDKPNIRYVIHYQMPASMEAYAQEIGRVGRDGGPGYAVLFHVSEDLQIHQHMVEKEYPTQLQVMQFYQWAQTAKDKPGSEALAAVDLTEEMVQLLTFYTEQAGLSAEVAATTEEMQDHVRRIWEQTEKRKRLKKQKLFEMLSYVEGTDDCLRKKLNRYFGEDQTAYSLYCCSRCGLEKQAYEGKSSVAHGKNLENSWDLRQALEYLLPKN
ncbi:RecQ family ATP-dependent DNA helicase [Brevibacillus choshinensis]|uniref:ATP-dependent DNA helicase RecQ n=1 Tax=Brevibacillus choshinensis TaxID=54911 RepID=A0ABX7FVS7_BRECH|nr:ATP-dependent DNA helicase RecQ [Brevibacillus choshinensis]QRG69875.1 RecQ family ATP-dependent DNA helicase [Brevibacillus choshinensis]